MSNITAADLRNVKCQDETCGHDATDHSWFGCERGCTCELDTADILAAAWPALVVDLDALIEWFHNDADENAPLGCQHAPAWRDCEHRARGLRTAMSWRTEAEVKAEALREAAEGVGPELSNEVGGHTSTYSVRKWLRDRADRISLLTKNTK